MKMAPVTGLVDCNFDSMEIIFYHECGGKRRYFVDIATIQNAPMLANWVYQLMGKNWVTPDIISDFLVCVDIACFKFFGKGAQSVFGTPPNAVNWDKWNVTQK